MARPARLGRFVPQCLQLEGRDVPAGNVTAALAFPGGVATLQVYGDAADNSVILHGGDTPGTVEVQGVGTTINGGKKKVTFAGVQALDVDTADGSDKVRCEGLALGRIAIRLGAGDDTAEVKGTTGGPTGLRLSVEGDASQIGTTGQNGDDTIVVSGTDVQGSVARFHLVGDVPADHSGADTIRLSNTTFVANNSGLNPAMFELVIQGGSTASGPGDEIKVNHLSVIAEGSGPVAARADVTGSGGDDQVDLKNIDLLLNSDNSAELRLGVQGGTGHDRVKLHNVNAVAVTPAGVALFNQVLTSLTAEEVTVRNVTTQGGSVDASGGYTGNTFQVVASNADLRNVSVTSANGFTYFTLYSPEVSSGQPAAGETFSLNNVTISQANALADPIGTSILTGGGDDRVKILNSSISSLLVDTGDGNDKLTLRHNAFGTAFFFGGNGEDDVELSNNSGEFHVIDFEDV